MVFSENPMVIVTLQHCKYHEVNVFIGKEDTEYKYLWLYTIYIYMFFFHKILKGNNFQIGVVIYRKQSVKIPLKFY